MGQRRQKTQALLTSPCLLSPSIIIRKQSCYLTKGTALKSHLSHLGSPIREEMTDGLLFWKLLHLCLLFTLSLFFFFNFYFWLHWVFVAAQTFSSWVAISFSKGYSRPGIKPVSPALADGLFTTEPPGKPHLYIYIFFFLKTTLDSRKTSTSALLTMLKPLTVWITVHCKILQEMEIPDHLICLLRNLYARQEATVRTRHGTTDWFQTGKGVCQGCILSPCLFNSYAEYIMRNAGLNEAQAGIKIAKRNINNLRYADDTTFIAESEEELKSLLMIASSPITSWQIDGEPMETVTDFIFLGLQNHCRWSLQQ